MINPYKDFPKVDAMCTGSRLIEFEKVLRVLIKRNGFACLNCFIETSIRLERYEAAEAAKRIIDSGDIEYKTCKRHLLI